MIFIFESVVNCFKDKTGLRLYDDMLDPSQLDYFIFRKGTKPSLERMTCRQYIQDCADLFEISYDDEIAPGVIDYKKVNEYADKMKSGEKFPMPFINFNKNFYGPSQEGRHRMLAMAKAFGEDSVTNVLVVHSYMPSDEEIKEYVSKAYKGMEDWGFNYIKGLVTKYNED